MMNIEFYVDGEWRDATATPLTHEWQPGIILSVNTASYFAALDRAQRALNRLRYPPKAPTKGSTSRRREKLKKAGIFR